MKKKTKLLTGTILLAFAMFSALRMTADEKTENPPAPAKTPGKPGQGLAGGGRGPGMMGKMPGFEPLPVTEEQAKAPVPDGRIYVPMPAEQKAILREQMKQFLVSLMQIQGLLAEGKLPEAADTAETTMGRTERGSHRGTKGGGPGLYMPIPMRTLAWMMHDTASEFAETASNGDVKESYKALQTLQTSCVTCHSTYSTR